MAEPTASIVLPVHNQADHIAAVIESYIDALRGFPHHCELLAVVNGPRRDDSLALCRALAGRHAGLLALCIDEAGWGRAVRHGIARASGDLICYTNAARTTPENLLFALNQAAAHPDAVIKASRKIRSGFGRRLGSLLYNLECRALFDLPYRDINGTPKVFARRHAALLKLARDDDLIDLELCIACRREGYRVIELPMFSDKRRSGRSTTTLASAFRMYRGAWQMRSGLPADADAG